MLKPISPETLRLFRGPRKCSMCGGSPHPCYGFRCEDCWVNALMNWREKQKSEPMRRRFAQLGERPLTPQEQKAAKARMGRRRVILED